MKAVILAGGKGTRLGEIASRIPKPMIPIGGKPILERQVLLLKEYGIRDIFLLIGHLGSAIREYFGDGSQWDVSISYEEEKEPQGTAGALRPLAGKIKDDFLLLSGDIMMNFDVGRFIGYHHTPPRAVVTALVHPSDHPLEADLVEVDDSGKITKLLTRPHPSNFLFHNISTASVYIISPTLFSFIPPTGMYDLEKHVFPQLLATNQPLFAYRTPEYIRDMGTPERFASVKADYESGRFRKGHVREKRPVIFLDRDGVINEVKNGGILCAEDLNVFDKAKEAIRKINESDFMCVIVTNQPFVAKGMLTQEGLDTIHKKMETELGKTGAKIDALYYCPHHPERGFEGEVPYLKIQCACRKPGIGMIEQAVEEFNLDLKNSFFIGDTTTDAKTAENAGIRFLGVKTGFGCNDGKYKIARPFDIFPSVWEAMNHILQS